ncbi:hypothetical protein [Rhodospirillum centenum]|uniref:Uncharacterized protein n=1 Tax=Rhodospirillum centenum (strain ATCC 51521 / SW) TaxID=414684 RepID=B6IME5_RHOCS|nr:hypothetical protein [Rhodospirillum centenum]ACI98524.1 phage-related hypothetical protein [Rhodospirillum centenum SW]
MNVAQLILLGIQIAEAIAAGVPEAIEAKKAIDRMLAENRDPTDEEWSALNAATAALHRRVQGEER